MEIPYHCSNCLCGGTFEENLAGTTIQCPECREKILLPDAAEVASYEPPPPKSVEEQILEEVQQQTELFRTISRRLGWGIVLLAPISVLFALFWLMFLFTFVLY